MPITHASFLALIIYEYVITLGGEFGLFWSQKWTGASVLFLVNRYMVLIYNLTLIRGFYPFSLAVSGFRPSTLLRTVD